MLHDAVNQVVVMKYAATYPPMYPTIFLTCVFAAYGGHLLEALKLARKMGFYGCFATCSAAKGHLDILKWTRQNGCEWNGDLCSATARMWSFS